MKYQYINLHKLSTQEIELLRLLDTKSVVCFSFWKKGDGGVGSERREAKGTRNLDYIPMDVWPKQPTEDVGNRINYYDLDKNEWRGMSVGQLIEIYKY